VLLFQISTSSNSPNSPEDSYWQKVAALEDCLVILELET
jgi:hypothetical protein